jgi:hypothetical protein
MMRTLRSLFFPREVRRGEPVPRPGKASVFPAEPAPDPRLLREMPSLVRQDRMPRRWFRSSVLELFAWHDEEGLCAFQICWGRGREAELVHWDRASGWIGGDSAPDDLPRRFQEAAGLLPPELAGRINQELQALKPGAPPRGRRPQ